MINSSTHRILDFVTVVAFALAPLVLGLTGLPAMLSYALAAIHLLMTLATHFPNGPSRPIPVSLHAMVELIVGIVLVVLPLVLGWTGAAKIFFMGAGVVILLVWIGSRGASHAHA